MKERTPEQLKGQIRSFAGKRNLQSQEVLQMFLLERVLDFPNVVNLDTDADQENKLFHLLLFFFHNI